MLDQGRLETGKPWDAATEWRILLDHAQTGPFASNDGAAHRCAYPVRQMRRLFRALP